ncbi:MAG: histidine phosphatase family protein [Gammaproteobacteria bacterium]|nr:histidine phosphatase family protein [Gammaproteobacteria bacterium]
MKISFFLYLFLHASISMAQQTSPLPTSSLHELVTQLQKGGYVIYFRHAKTNLDQMDTDREKLNDCSKQRNLSDEGKQQAKLIGQAFKTLKIKINELYSSPYCRCIDTAHAISNNIIIDKNLRYLLGLDEINTNLLSEYLKKMILKQPTSNTNTVIVSHTANLQEAMNLWPEPEGVAYIFKPDSHQAQLVGKILPKQWAEITEQKW